jgi:putative transposase
MCRALGVSRSGYYEWLRHPVSNRGREDQRLLGLIRASHVASGGVYGAPRIFLDLREAGETCSKHRVARLMRMHKIRANYGYRRPRAGGGRASAVAPNTLERGFNVSKPNRAWVTDITYVRTWEGWLYLGVVMDLYSRRIIGWATKPTMARELVLDAILMAVKRRHPKRALIHSDQGSQYGSDDWLRFCRSHHLEPSMSRRGNCWDNAVAESFFSSLKKERIKKRIYRTRALAHADIADYIEAFYNPIRRHSYLNGVSPEAFEAVSEVA